MHNTCLCTLHHYMNPYSTLQLLAQSVGPVEYADSISAEGGKTPLPLTSVWDMTIL